MLVTPVMLGVGVRPRPRVGLAFLVHLAVQVRERHPLVEHREIVPAGEHFGKQVWAGLLVHRATRRHGVPLRQPVDDGPPERVESDAAEQGVADPRALLEHSERRHAGQQVVPRLEAFHVGVGVDPAVPVDQLVGGHVGPLHGYTDLRVAAADVHAVGFDGVPHVLVVERTKVGLGPVLDLVPVVPPRVAIGDVLLRHLLRAEPEAVNGAGDQEGRRHDLPSVER